MTTNRSPTIGPSDSTPAVEGRHPCY